MVKLTNYLSRARENHRQKPLPKPFTQRIKQLKIKSQHWLSQKKGQVKNSIKKIPFNYRNNISNNLSGKILSIIFFIIFIANLVLPTNQALKIKKAFLDQPDNFNNQIKMIDALIANGYFEMAKKELNKIGNPIFLSEEERVIWQEKYLLWTQKSPEGQKELTSRWQKFASNHPYYKIGWLQLGCYQQLAKNEAAAQESFQKAENIDPGLEEEIKKLTQK